ncbi:Hypothetical_protein [Hexamita inflata]|uniref:Hypothetical_protein n=1 Tax=Hexamita inflata TaxID=28002 RepID=A0AA86UYW7_9EUKA|nr:Hypothetical protein HINF_LOCUS61259 [Hexamita inflata]
MRIGFDRAIFFVSELKGFTWQYIKLSLFEFQIYLVEFTGNFNELTFDQCTLTHMGVEELNCQTLTLRKCNLRFCKMGSRMFKNNFHTSNKFMYHYCMKNQQYDTS